MARRPARSTKIEQQIKALRMRVSFLERALRPAKKASGQLIDLDRERKHAEDDAHYKAMMEYYEKKKVERYLRNPSMLAADLAHEREIADFLRSRGLKPEPSRIPKQFHRGLKGYQPKREG